MNSKILDLGAAMATLCAAPSLAAVPGLVGDDLEDPEH